MERKKASYLRDVAMNNIGAFLKDELDFEKTDYFDHDHFETECHFFTKDGKE